MRENSGFVVPARVCSCRRHLSIWILITYSPRPSLNTLRALYAKPLAACFIDTTIAVCEGLVFLPGLNIFSVPPCFVLHLKGRWYDGYMNFPCLWFNDLLRGWKPGSYSGRYCRWLSSVCVGIVLEAYRFFRGELQAPKPQTRTLNPKPQTLNPKP